MQVLRGGGALKRLCLMSTTAESKGDETETKSESLLAGMTLRHLETEGEKTRLWPFTTTGCRNVLVKHVVSAFSSRFLIEKRKRKKKMK